jgi:hypothetical protein
MREQEKSSVVRLEETPPGEALPFSIELWDAARGETVERVLARAHNAPLARAIFKAVVTEHPGRRITLRSGARLLADSRQSDPPHRAV